VKLMSNSLVFEATGTLADFTIQALQLTGPGWQFTIPLAGAKYIFPIRGRSWFRGSRNRDGEIRDGLALNCPAETGSCCWS